MLITNAFIVTFDENNKIIPNGYVEFEDGIIKKIGSMDDLKIQGSADDVIDAKGKLLFPGFICMHTHIYSAFARGMSGDTPRNFIQILEKLWWRIDKKLTHEDIYYSALVTVMDCIKNGVTCIFDHHAGSGSIDGSLDVIEKAFNELNMRGTLCYEVSDRDGLEKAERGIHENSRFIKKANGCKDDMVKGLFGLHAAFTLSDETLKKASSEGNSLNAGFHVHAGEGKYDEDYNKKRYGRGAVQRLDDFGVLNDKTLLVHCIHVDDHEKELLKKCNVIHNPESNMNNAAGYCDVLNLLERGILVGLGSDGFSSNHLRAMDTCYILHKHEKKDPGVMSPYDVVKLGIINNGKIASKFFKEPVGVIKEGAKCDLITIKYDPPTPMDKNNIFAHIIFGINSSMITDTIINGKIVMKDRIIGSVNEKEIMKKSRDAAQKLWKRL